MCPRESYRGFRTLIKQSNLSFVVIHEEVDPKCLKFCHW